MTALSTERLDAIERLAAQDYHAVHSDDVDALIAEVRRLRAAAGTATCHDCGGRSDDTDDSVGDLISCDLCDPGSMVCVDCMHRLDERGEAEGSGGIRACGGCYSDACFRDADERARSFESALRALVDALPKCDDESGQCTAPATRRQGRESEAYCDAHAAAIWTAETPPHEYAAPLRAAIVLLETKETT